MRRYLVLLTFLVSVAARAATPPQLLLDITRFRNEDLAVKGAVVELYATVPGQSLTYKRRAPRYFRRQPA